MIQYKCINCNQEYDGKLEFCPNCGCPTEYQTEQISKSIINMIQYKCTDCGQIYDGNLGVCPNCGCPTKYQTAQISQSINNMIQYKCTDCGQVYDGNLEACPNCGCPTKYQTVQISQSINCSQEVRKCPSCGTPYSIDSSTNEIVCSCCGNEIPMSSKLEETDFQSSKTLSSNNSPFSGSTGGGKQAYSMAENNLSRYPVSPIFKENYQATDTNGPMGECLFPTNDEGKIIYQGVIVAPCSKAALKECAIRFFRELDKNPMINVKTIQTEYESRYDFDVILSSGKVRQEIHYAKYYRDRSRIRCHVAIEFKEGRYRYTVNPYETNRLNLRGKAKCDGTPNEIHWQRVNSLNKRWDSHIIDYENETYKAEYEAVINLVKLLANYYNEMNQEADF